MLIWFNFLLDLTRFNTFLNQSLVWLHYFHYLSCSIFLVFVNFNLAHYFQSASSFLLQKWVLFLLLICFYTWLKYQNGLFAFKFTAQNTLSILDWQILDMILIFIIKLKSLWSRVKHKKWKIVCISWGFVYLNKE